MNTEELTLRAGVAIVEFQKLNNGPCYLAVENSAVHCYPFKKSTDRIDNCLILTQWQQQNGLTSGQWTAIGTSLFNQYNREVACQARQKHWRSPSRTI